MTAVVLPIAPDQLPRLLADPELFDEYLDTAAVDFEDRWTDVIHALRLLINNDQVTFQSVATSFGEDLGYGPAMLINAEHVAHLAHLVATVSQGDISSASERAIGNNEPEDPEWLTSVVSDTIHLIRTPTATDRH
jgi:hypothetical protein